jgi:formylglycine-generating enzyme required for sulfatase activity
MEDKDRHEQLTKYANAQGVNPSGNGKNLPLPVGSLRPNVFGLYDTLGNLAEVNWPAEENILQNYDGLCFQGGDYDCERDSLNLNTPEQGIQVFIHNEKGDSTTGFRIVRKDSR